MNQYENESKIFNACWNMLKENINIQQGQEEQWQQMLKKSKEICSCPEPYKKLATDMTVAIMGHLGQLSTKGD